MRQIPGSGSFVSFFHGPSPEMLRTGVGNPTGKADILPDPPAGFGGLFEFLILPDDQIGTDIEKGIPFLRIRIDELTFFIQSEFLYQQHFPDSLQ